MYTGGEHAASGARGDLGQKMPCANARRRAGRRALWTPGWPASAAPATSSHPRRPMGGPAYNHQAPPCPQLRDSPQAPGPQAPGPQARGGRSHIRRSTQARLSPGCNKREGPQQGARNQARGGRSRIRRSASGGRAWRPAPARRCTASPGARRSAWPGGVGHGCRGRGERVWVRAVGVANEQAAGTLSAAPASCHHSLLFGPTRGRATSQDTQRPRSSQFILSYQMGSNPCPPAPLSRTIGMPRGTPPWGHPWPSSCAAE